MNAIDFAKHAMETSKHLVLTLIMDMKDAPLTQPTAKGGNHPLWILGHLVYSEANIISDILLGETNPLAEWSDIFGGGSEPVTDVSHYPPFDEVAAKYEEVRERTMTLLNCFTEADFDKPSKNCPEDREAFFGTAGKCFAVIALHPALHYGQVADARRTAGRQALIA